MDGKWMEGRKTMSHDNLLSVDFSVDQRLSSSRHCILMFHLLINGVEILSFHLPGRKTPSLSLPFSIHLSLPLPFFLKSQSYCRSCLNVIVYFAPFFHPSVPHVLLFS